MQNKMKIWRHLKSTSRMQMNKIFHKNNLIFLNNTTKQCYLERFCYAL